MPPAPPPEPVYEKVTISATALFDFDSDVLKDEGKAAIQDLSDSINAKGGSVVDVDVVGHTEDTQESRGLGGDLGDHRWPVEVDHDHRGSGPEHAEDAAALRLLEVQVPLMEHRLDHVATKLSGGERQRVAVARALVGSPSIVLADEPTGNLDSKNSDAIVELIRQINDEGVTFVVITHNREIAEAFPRTVGLRDGRIEYDSGKR